MILSELLPHRPPMLLIQEPLEITPDFCQAQVKITAQSPFIRLGQVPAHVALEYFAQTAAAHAGWLARQSGETPRPGRLVACRKLSLEVAGFKLGELLSVEVSPQGEGAGAHSYRGRLRRLPGGELLAEGVITLILV
ncbi:MAG: hypothetical protein RRB13_15045 [bacterium]|nr:hypothetical protein [bacterium]